MALGSEASKRRREQRRREQHTLLDVEYKRAKAAFEPRLQQIMDKHGIAYAERVVDLAMRLEALSWIAKDPPEYFKENLRRLFYDEPPMPRPRADPAEPFHRPGKVRRRLGEEDPDRMARIRERLSRRFRGS